MSGKLHSNRRYIGKWFNGHEHRNHSYWIQGTCEVVTTEACADYKPGEAKGIARLVEVYSDNHVEMSMIYGQWSAAKITSADTTVYGDRNKLGSVQAVEIKE